MNAAIFNIINQMSQYLSAEQLRELQKVLIINLVEGKTEEVQHDYSYYVEMLISAKILEGKSRQSMDSYVNSINRVLSYCEGSIQSITTEQLRNAMNLVQQEHNCNNYAMDTKRRHLSSFFNWLVEEEYLVRNPMARIHKIKYTKVVKRVYSDDNLEHLRCYCKNIRELAIVDLLNSTGMRVGELHKLNIEDVDLERKECKVHGKGDKERITYLDARAKLHLTQYLESRNDNNKALIVSMKRPHDRMSISGIERIIHDLGVRSGVKDCHPHKFRASTATRAIDKGMPIEQVKELLGHTQIDTTLIYAQVNQKNVKLSHEKYLC
ncbi:MAG: tyrosine-type recombinase/integrase [Lachnospiraceae bacterium]|nr:tyrosine-type recombinase/integrase [Lachnospiraceae bacterium]